MTRILGVVHSGGEKTSNVAIRACFAHFAHCGANLRDFLVILFARPALPVGVSKKAARIWSWLRQTITHPAGRVLQGEVVGNVKRRALFHLRVVSALAFPMWHGQRALPVFSEVS